MSSKSLNCYIGSSTLYFVILLLLSACSPSSGQKEGAVSIPVKVPAAVSPNVVEATAPTIYHLDSMPAPEVFSLSASTNSKNYIPPKKDSASFFVAIQNYTTEHGLALDAISSSYVDHLGNIWFSTYGGGISKFNGSEFINYTSEHGLSNDVVWSIAEDANGNMWFGTDGGGLCKFDGRKFVEYGEKDGMSSNIVYAIVIDDNDRLWAGTQGGGLVMFDGSNFVKYNTGNSALPSNTIHTIVEDRNAALWLGTDGGGISHFKDGKFKNYTTKDGLAGNTIKCLLKDRKGYIWMGSLDKGLSVYDGKKFTNYSSKDGLGSNHVLSLEEDSEGNIWIGTDGGGVDKFNGKSFVNFSVNQGMPNNIVKSIVEDRSENLWFGTDGGGVGKYIGKSFTNYFTAQGLANNVVWSITEDSDSNLWFGTDGGGASKYNGRTFTHYTTAQGLADNVVWCITEDSKGNLWFGTYGGGVSMLNSNSITNYSSEQGLASDIVYAIIEDSKGNLWFGTHGSGISKFNGKRFENYTTKNGLPNDIVRVIEEDHQGNLWLATQGGGVVKFDGNSFTNYTTEHGLANDIVLDIYEDSEGILWFGTYSGGVSRFDGNNFYNYNSEHGLPDNTVTQVIGTAQGQLAVGTNMGIVILESFSREGSDEILPSINALNNNELLNYNPNFAVYNSSTGYLVKDVNTGQSCMFLDSKGSIWLGTGSDKTALVRFDPEGLNQSTEPPNVFIKSVKINEENILWGILDSDYHEADSNAIATEEAIVFADNLTEAEKDSMKLKYQGVHFESIAPFYPIPEKLVLPYAHNNIEFEFGAVETSKPDQLRYQFMLEGYDKQWSPVLKKSSASFGNIAEGIYTFRLKAQNSEGIWSEPISFSFEVLPPWYRRWWAIAIYSILIFLFLYAVYRYRTASLRKDKEVLEQTVKERTAELVLQKEEAEKQRSLVEVKNREITDSINYALRIQQAILPKIEDIQLCFPKSFILYKPKDIVSGDYYFFQKAKTENNKDCDETFILAVADCTGHGVPGALMSMVGFERLTDAVEHSSDPNIVLSLLNRGMKNSLHQNTDESTRDGMDIALCSIDLKSRLLKFAGANRPLWYIKSGESEVREIKGTRAAIGGFTAEGHEFEIHEVPFEKGDTFYLFSDGYPDLFSSDGKKLTIKKFREKIQQVNKLQSMKEQKMELEKFANNWMAGEEQIDDILIIGLRF